MERERRRGIGRHIGSNSRVGSGSRGRANGHRNGHQLPPRWSSKPPEKKEAPAGET